MVNFERDFIFLYKILFFGRNLMFLGDKKLIFQLKIPIFDKNLIFWMNFNFRMKFDLSEKNSQF